MYRPVTVLYARGVLAVMCIYVIYKCLCACVYIVTDPFLFIRRLKINHESHWASAFYS
jgi:hypothetical protein